MRPRLLTHRAIWLEIEALEARDGMPPTIDELRRAFRVGSTRTIYRYLKEMEAAGYLKRWPGARGMKRLRKPRPTPAPPPRP